MTSIPAPCFDPLVTQTGSGRRTGARANVIAHTLMIAVTLAVISWAADLRWSLASTTSWHCDEIPLLTGFTGLRGQVTTESAANRFAPSFYSWRMGALRALRPPEGVAAIHTTTNFWTNLTVHLFGCTPAAGRLMPFVWSMLAIPIVAWAAWLASRSIPAACLAAWVMALSPHATAYAAQARGYAEALALAPLLLLALEFFRRRPDSGWRAAWVFLCALQLSLTVYTVWLYWVLPTLAVALILWPRIVPSAASPSRAAMFAIAIGLGAFMTVYTLDRWTSLAFTGSQMGLRPQSWSQFGRFIADSLSHLLLSPTWLAALALAGVPALWKSQTRWWLWVFAASIAVPAAFTIVNGSPGYPRNLGYLAGLLAILIGKGVDTVMRHAIDLIDGAVRGQRPKPRQARKWVAQGASGVSPGFAPCEKPTPGEATEFRRAAIVPAVAALLMISVAAVTHAGHESRARAILLPDWGEAVRTIARAPTTVGPRWFCGCLANHWQINWYRSHSLDNAVLSIPIGGQIEIIMGAQFDDEGRAKVFRLNQTGDLILEEPLPDYLTAVPPSEARDGIEFRRWIGTRTAGPAGPRILSRSSPPADSHPHPDAPILLLVMNATPPPEAWRRFVRDSNSYARGVVTFKSIAISRTPHASGGPWVEGSSQTAAAQKAVETDQREIGALIAPADAIPAIIAALESNVAIEPDAIRIFTLHARAHQIAAD